MKLETNINIEIQSLRQEIKQIDHNIFNIIQKRNDIAREIGNIKKANNLAIRDVAIEKINQAKLIQQHPNIKPKNIIDIQKILITMAIEAQTKN